MNLPMTRPRLTSGMNAIAAMPSAGKTGTYDANDASSRYVTDDDRHGIRGIGTPRRVTFDRAPVFLRKPAVGFEAHDAVAVEQQNRGAFDA